MDHKCKVLIAQTIVPHYRVPVFDLLSKVPWLDLYVAFGREREGTRPRSVNVVPFKTIQLKNHFLLASEVRFQARILNRVWRREFDVLIVEFDLWNVTSLFLFLIARLRNIPLIWWGHGLGQSGRTWIIQLRLALVRWSTALITYHDKGKNQFVKRGLPPDKIFVAYNSVDTSEISRCARVLDSRDRKYLLFVGRLIPEKRIDLLLSAFALITKRFDELRLCVIGDGPEMDAIQKMSIDLAIADRCLFPGPLFDQKQLAPYFASSLAFVNPGPIGLGIVHSFAYGVPMITHRKAMHHPEIEYLQENVNGLLFDSDRPKDLAEFICRYLSNPDKIERLAKGAKRTADTISIDSMLQGFVSAIRYSTEQSGV